MKRNYAVIVMMATLAAGSFAAELTEKQVVDAVMANSPAIAAAQKEYGAAQAASHASWWLKNPMVEVELMGLDGSSLRLDTSMSKNLSITQEIPSPLRLPFAIGAANEAVSMAMWRSEMAAREAEQKAHAAYASLYRTIKEIEVTQQSSGALQQISRAAAARYGREGGEAGDAAKADLEYALLVNRLQELEQEKTVRAAALAALSNGAVNPAADDMFLPPDLPGVTGTASDAESAALANSPEIRMAAAGVKMAENMRNGAMAGYFPDITVKYTRQVDPGSDNYSLMFGFEVPLWFFTAQQSMIGEAGGGYDAAAKKYDEARNSVKLAAREMYESLRTHERTMNLYSGILIPQAEAALQAQTASYKARKTDFMRVLDSERMLLDMKKDYYMHMEEFIMEYYALKAMTEEE